LSSSTLCSLHQNLSSSFLHDLFSGAGIQADLKTLTSLHVYGSSVLTSITSQNTMGVDGIHTLPKEFVAKQLHAVLSDIGTDAIKTGMLASAEIIEIVADVMSILMLPSLSLSIQL
jgi:hydroxymethylpyrimidine/phosphomethylpyrimidine kinase